jgi:hypothetical protein
MVVVVVLEVIVTVVVVVTGHVVQQGHVRLIGEVNVEHVAVKWIVLGRIIVVEIEVLLVPGQIISVHAVDKINLGELMVNVVVVVVEVVVITGVDK